MKSFGTVRSYLLIIIFAFLAATNFEIFILNNSFAPAGINGIATMIQYKLGISVGYLNLAFNIPLCIVALFFVDKEFIAKSLTFTVSFSLFLILYRNKVVNLDAFVYVTSTGHTV